MTPALSFWGYGSLGNSLISLGLSVFLLFEIIEDVTVTHPLLMSMSPGKEIGILGPNWTSFPPSQQGNLWLGEAGRNNQGRHSYLPS